MKKKYQILIASLILLIACTNPFAPKKMQLEDGMAVLGDQSTIEGVFKNFRYSYIFKDTVVYGRLLADDFTFVFTDFDKGGIEVSWGREEDMILTSRLFDATQNLDLIWNEIVSQSGDSLTRDIKRSFNLTITFNPNDQPTLQGRAHFVLRRENPEDDWKIKNWYDESF